MGNREVVSIRRAVQANGYTVGVTERVLGVLAGRDISDQMLSRWVRSAEMVFAADGAANAFGKLALDIDCVVGDFDSIEPHVQGPKLHHAPEQDSTDCDKLLALAYELGERSITLAGVEGDLPDHVLSTLYSAARSQLAVRFAYRRGIGWIISPARAVSYPSAAGRRISLLPLAPCLGVNLTGVKWPLDQATLHPHGLVSISNEAESAKIECSIVEGSALLFIEYPEKEMPFW